MSEHNMLIIDDEALARDAVRNIIQSYCPHVHIAGEAASVAEALHMIRDLKPDFITLDIDLGDGTGFDLLKQLENPPKIIFITAHNDKAIDAFKCNAVDYILKPYQPFDLIEAVKKTLDDLQRKNGTLPEMSLKLQQDLPADQLVLSSLNGFEIVRLADIVFVEADNNYSVFHLTDLSKKTVSKTIKHYEEILSAFHFFRCHQSFIINYRQIKSYIKGEGGTLILQNGAQIEVSRRKKDELLTLIQDKFIK